MSNNPFSPWWYYQMGQSNPKKPNQTVSVGNLTLAVIIAIISLIMLGALVATLIWYML